MNDNCIHDNKSESHDNYTYNKVSTNKNHDFIKNTLENNANQPPAKYGSTNTDITAPPHPSEIEHTQLINWAIGKYISLL